MQAFSISCIRLGPIPKHVAFIMDGNRRFAKRNSMETSRGHVLGFSQLEKILDLCLKLGIHVVSVYAFSIENFKRKPDEVEKLMQLAQEKFEEFAKQSSLVDQLGVSIRVSGSLKRLPEPVQQAAVKAMNATRHHKNGILNICCPYTSRDEITLAMSDVIKGVQSGRLYREDVTEQLLDQALFTGDLPPLDMLVRTSGEIRLSDYMLWQASDDCLLHFTNALWPEFSFWDMLQTILLYQLRCARNKIFGNRRIETQTIEPSPESQTRISAFLSWLRQDRILHPLNH